MIITTGLTGILHASFELARRLESAGHEITCGSPQDKKEYIETQGFSFIKLPSIQFEINAFYLSEKNKLKFHFDALFHKSKLHKRAHSSLHSEKIIKTFETSEADLFLVDIELHEYILPLYSLHKKFLLISQWFNLWESNKLPPLQSPNTPDELNETSTLQLWNNDARNRKTKYEKKVKKYANTDRQSLLQSLAEQLKIDSDELLPYHWPSPFIYKSFPVISTTCEALEFNKSEREHLYYVGPIVYAQRKESESRKNMSHKVQKIIANKDRHNKKIIYCSLTTMKSSDTLIIQKIINATQLNEDLILIISIGNSDINKINICNHKNAHLFNWVPQLEVLKQADLSINHGGIHTINECIHFKVPMLIYSGNEHDQNGCAARVHHYGAGKMGNKEIDNEKEIYKDIIDVLFESSYRIKISDLYNDYMMKKSEKRLEHVIEKALTT